MLRISQDISQKLLGKSWEQFPGNSQELILKNLSLVIPENLPKFGRHFLRLFSREIPWNEFVKYTRMGIEKFLGMGYKKFLGMGQIPCNLLSSCLSARYFKYTTQFALAVCPALQIYCTSCSSCLSGTSNIFTVYSSCLSGTSNIFLVYSSCLSGTSNIFTSCSSCLSGTSNIFTVCSSCLSGTSNILHSLIQLSVRYFKYTAHLALAVCPVLQIYCTV